MFVELTLRISKKVVYIAVDNIAYFMDDPEADGSVIVFKSIHRQIMHTLQWRDGCGFLVTESPEEIKKKLFDLSFGNQINEALQK